MSKDDPQKQSRLAEALRANLHRRKAQARETTRMEAEVSGDIPPAEPITEPSRS